MKKKIYGAWINPKGKLIQVEGQCEHKLYCDYQSAHNEGWVCIVYGSWRKKSYIPDYFCARLNPGKVTKAALKTLLKVINESDKFEFCFEDIYKNPFKDFTWNSSVVDLIHARKIIRDINARKIKSRR